MKRTSYIILTVIALLFILSYVLGRQMEARNNIPTYSIEYQKNVKKKLPKFSHIVIKDHFNEWYKGYLYLSDNNNMENNIEISYVSGLKENEIEMPQNLMDNSRFNLHGDTLYIELGCPKNFAENLYKEIGSNEDLKKRDKYRIKFDGHLYEMCSDGYIVYKNYKMEMNIGNNFSSIDNQSGIGISFNKIRQDSLKVSNMNGSYFLSCDFDKLNLTNSRIGSNINLEKTNVRKLHLPITEGRNSFSSSNSSRVNECFLEGTTDENHSVSLPSLNYGHPFTIHWTPKGNTGK